MKTENTYSKHVLLNKYSLGNLHLSWNSNAAHMMMFLLIFYEKKFHMHRQNASPEKRYLAYTVVPTLYTGKIGKLQRFIVIFDNFIKKLKGVFASTEFQN